MRERGRDRDSESQRETQRETEREEKKKNIRASLTQQCWSALTAMSGNSAGITLKKAIKTINK